MLFSVEYRPYVRTVIMVPVAQLAEHLTVDQVVEGSSPFAHLIDVGKIPHKINYHTQIWVWVVLC